MLDVVIPCGKLVGAETRDLTMNPGKRHESVTALD
jgi:hypothetical protein